MEGLTRESINMKLDYLRNCSDVPRKNTLEVNYPAIKNAETALKKLIEKFPNHDNLDEIYLKVDAINSLYSTNIYDTYKIAYHIKVRINDIDSRLKEGDFKLIEEIGKNHGIHNKDGKERFFYSFATKYCSFHNQKNYAIYDNLIQDLLLADYNKGKVKTEKKNYESLRKYESFMEMVHDFIHRHRLIEVSIKDIDTYLWILGKEKELEKINNLTP